jgi:hypothetical protein
MASRAGAAVVLVALAALVQPAATQGVAAAAQTHAGLLADLDRFLLLDGAVETSSLGLAMVFPLAGVAIPLGLTLYGRRSPIRLRVAWLWLPAAVAVGTTLAILGYEAARVGSPRYYGVKAMCAATLVAGSVALVASAYVLDGLLSRRTPPIAVKVGVTVLTAAMLLFDGGPVRLGPLDASPGGATRAYLASAGPELRQGLSEAVLASCATIAGRPGEYYLLVAGATHDDLVRANVWLITCGLGWGAEDRASVLRDLLPDKFEEGRTVIDVSVDTRRILQARPHARVIVSTDVVPLARQGLTSAEKDRVVSY